jgi:hypothetical protein
MPYQNIHKQGLPHGIADSRIPPDVHRTFARQADRAVPTVGTGGEGLRPPARQAAQRAHFNPG